VATNSILEMNLILGDDLVARALREGAFVVPMLGRVRVEGLAARGRAQLLVSLPVGQMTAVD